MEEFEIGFKNEQSDFMEMLWHTQSKRLAMFSIIPIIVAFSFLFAALLKSPIDPANDKRWIIYISIPLVVILILVSLYIGLLRQAKQHSEAAEFVTMYFDDVGIQSRSIKGSATSPWSAFDRIQESSTQFLFWVDSNICFPVPKRAFDNSEQINQLRRHLREQLGERVSLESSS